MSERAVHRPSAANCDQDWEIRAGQEADWPAVVALVGQSMRWADDQPLAEYLAWKHLHNHFGASPVWVAVAGDRVVGVRVLLRWEFEAPGRPVVRAVRAVDTATAESHRGLGIFTALTLAGIAASRESGYDLVYNTPNDQSRPGYLKMGWRIVGRLPVSVRPTRPSALPTMLRSGVAADRLSIDTGAGQPVAEVLSDETALMELLALLPPPTGLRTRRSPAYLRWRYDSFGPLRYRAVVLGEARRGLAIFRLRRRGRTTEAAVVEALAPDRKGRSALLAKVAQVCGADHAIALTRGAASLYAGYVPVPRLGPILTCRELAGDRPGPSARWELALGDIELF